MNTNINFRNLAIDATTLSHLMDERSKITTEEVIAKYPEGITISEFDFVNMGEDNYYICTFKEDPTRFLNTGAVLGKIFDKYVQAYEGSIADASNGLKKSGGLKVKLGKGTTRSGNAITTVTIL